MMFPSSTPWCYSPISKGKNGLCYQILREEIRSTKGSMASLALKGREEAGASCPRAGPCPYLGFYGITHPQCALSFAALVLDKREDSEGV